MPRQEAIAIAHAMCRPLDEVEMAISRHQRRTLARASIGTLGQLRDRLLLGSKIPGIGPAIHDKLWNVLKSLQILGDPTASSYVLVATESYKAGLASGAAEEQGNALTQKVRFELKKKLSIEGMKNKVLEAYEKKLAYIGLKAVIEYDVPGLCPMAGMIELVFSVDGMNKMLRAWNPGMPDPVTSNTVWKMDGVAPRTCNISMELDSWTGILWLKPPDEEAAKRHEQFFNTGK